MLSWELFRFLLLIPYCKASLSSLTSAPQIKCIINNFIIIINQLLHMELQVGNNNWPWVKQQVVPGRSPCVSIESEDPCSWLLKKLQTDSVTHRCRDYFSWCGTLNPAIYLACWVNFSSGRLLKNKRPISGTDARTDKWKAPLERPWPN